MGRYALYQRTFFPLLAVSDEAREDNTYDITYKVVAEYEEAQRQLLVKERDLLQSIEAQLREILAEVTSVRSRRRIRATQLLDRLGYLIRITESE